MSYESIVITKHAANVWFAKDNTLPGGVAGHFVSGWSGGVNSDQFTLKSKNGGIVYNNQPWSIFSYVDNLDSGNNFTPSSAVDLVVKLTQRDFFEYSSSGGGGVDTFLQLLDVLFPNYAGRAGQIIRINSGETGLESVTPSFAFQNNIGKWYTQSIPGTGDITPAELSDLINSGAQFLFSVTETSTPVFISALRTEEGITRQYIYLFMAGKPPTGTVWGAGGEPTIPSQFRRLLINVITPQDIEDAPNSEIFPLGDTTGDNFWDVASLQDPPFDLTNSGELDDDGNPRTYYFSFTDAGVLYFAQFIGTPGYYGVGETAFEEADFVDITNDTVTPTPDLQQVTTTGNTTTNPIVINDPNTEQKVSYEANGQVYTDSDGNTITDEYPEEAATGDAVYKRPAKTGTQTYAMLSDLLYLSVKDFGAVGDGVTDDTLAIRACFLAAKTGSVKRVFFPIGIYMISGTLYLSSDIEYFGAGKEVTIIRNTATASTTLDLITPLNQTSPATGATYKWKSMICTEGADYTVNTSVENIKIHDLEIDWNDNTGGVNSISPLFFGRAHNCHAYNISIPSALPVDLNAGQPKHFGHCMMFAFSEDCTLQNSYIGSSDYESISVWFLSKRIGIYGNILEGEKPLIYDTQSHLFQIARPTALINGLTAQYGETMAGPVFIEGNTFHLIENCSQAVTSHRSKGVYVRKNNFIYYPTTGAAIAVKPFDGTIDFDISSNLADMRNYNQNQIMPPVFSVDTFVLSGTPPVENGRISSNHILIKNTTPLVGTPTYPVPVVIGGYILDAKNIEISNNIVELDGYDDYPFALIGASGQGINVFGNTFVLKNPFTAITSAGPKFFHTNGGSNINIANNIVSGTDLGQGVTYATSYGFTKVLVSSNSFPTIAGDVVLPDAQLSVTALSWNGIKADENGNIVSTPDATPTNGSPNTVSSGGVYGALLLKQDTLVSGTNVKTLDGQTLLGAGNIVIGVKTLFADTVDSPAVTGTTSETILKSYLIPANSISTGTLSFEALFSKTGTAGTCAYNVKINTSNSLSGATTIATTGSVTATDLSKVLSRKGYLKAGNNLTIYPAGSGVSVPAQSSLAPTTVTFNPTVDNYVIVSVTLANAADSAMQVGFEMTYRN